MSGAVDGDDDEPTASLMTYHQYHHYGGVTLIIALSLETLGVPVERRAEVEQIRTYLLGQMHEARAAEQRLITILADELESNRVDLATVDDAVAQVSEAAANVHEASEDVLNHLHAILSPAERAALSDKVEAHWRLWQRANARNYDVMVSNPARVAELATLLNLTPEQVSEIHARQYERQRSRSRPASPIVGNYLRNFVAAFRSPDFNAKALDGGHDANASLAGWGAEYLAHFVESIRPVLTPPQRETFSRLLRGHADHELGDVSQ